MIGKILTATILSLGAVTYEAVEPPKTEEKICYVTIVNDSKGGELYTNITEGNVGDICTIYVGENLFYDLSYVEVNGTNLIANEDNTYTFALIEGENVIKSSFIINNEEISGALQALESAKNGDWSSIFNVDNLLIVINWLITTFLTSGLFVTLIKTRKIKAKTANEIYDKINEVSQSTVAEAINKFLETTMGESLNTIIEKLDSTNEVCKVLARCMELSQEDTPEARLAIIKELTNLKTNEEELSNKIKSIIYQQIEENNKIQREKIEKLEELKQANDNIQKIESDNNDLKGSY